VDGRDKGRWRDATHQRLEELAEARLAVVVEHQHRLDHLEASEGKWKEKKREKKKAGLYSTSALKTQRGAVLFQV
jgi:hypothetical protein